MWYIQSTWICAYRIFMMKPQGNRPLGRPRHRWKVTTKMGLKEAGWEVNWINPSQDRDKWYPVLNTVKNLQVP
jgi:hypothetical protein